MRTARGYTLVELLVVISIIAILSSIGLTVYSSAQKNARTAKRIQDLQAIGAALEIYYSVNNTYPFVIGNSDWRSECLSWGGYSSDQVIPGLVPKYMLNFPSDPSMDKNASTSCYRYRSIDGNDYKLLDYKIIEFTSSDYQSQKNLIDPARDGGLDPCIVDGADIESWAVYSSTISACW